MMETESPADDKIRSCPDCGLLNALPVCSSGMAVICARCHGVLTRSRHHSFDYIIACAMAAFVFCLILVTAPFIHIVLYGRFQNSTLWTGLHVFDQERLLPLASVVLFTALLMPLVKLALINIVLIGARMKNPPHYLPTLYRFVRHTAHWAMLEVYLLGFLVAYTRLKAMAYVQVDTALYALCGAIVLSATVDASLDSEEIWEMLKLKCGGAKAEKEAENKTDSLLGCHSCFYPSATPPGDKCPRCGATVHPRKPDSLAHTWAYMLGALIFYIPANVFPIMNTTMLGSTSSHTIIGGMMEFVHAGFLPLALLIFVASIAVPLLKLVSLFYMLIATHSGSANNLIVRMRLYRIIRFIGRWSMVDVFMLSIMVALIQFGQLARITSGIGAACFAAVVVLTMLAVESFDTRVMWDRAEKNGVNEA